MGDRVIRQTVSIMDAVVLVGCSRRTIYNWLDAGKVEYVRTAGGSIRIFEDTLWRAADGSRLPSLGMADQIATRNFCLE